VRWRFFYAGTVFGYFVGLPVFYAWMIQMASYDPTIQQLNLRLRDLLRRLRVVGRWSSA